jgi:hypothetical protein
VGEPVRWQHLLADALNKQPVVGVRAVIEHQLRRPATRAELHAARRAAHRLAEDGRGKLHYVDARRGDKRRRSKMLLIGRVGMPSINWPDAEALELAATIFPTPTRSNDQNLWMVLGRVT